VGIPISQDPDTLVGLESWLSVGILRILAEVPHSTELELGKLHRIRTDSGRVFMLELLRGLPTKLGSHPALKTLPLSLLYKE
jgi:hypothetical protein